MFQPSFERAQRDADEAPLGDDFCPHCGRGAAPIDDDLELELAADELEAADAELAPAADKAAFVAALRKESR